MVVNGKENYYLLPSGGPTAAHVFRVEVEGTEDHMWFTQGVYLMSRAHKLRARETARPRAVKTK